MAKKTIKQLTITDVVWSVLNNEVKEVTIRSLSAEEIVVGYRDKFEMELADYTRHNFVAGGNTYYLNRVDACVELRKKFENRISDLEAQIQDKFDAIKKLNAAIRDNERQIFDTSII